MSTFTPLPADTFLDNGRYVLTDDPNSQKSLKHVLGRGGMGAVYLAENTLLTTTKANMTGRLKIMTRLLN